MRDLKLRAWDFDRKEMVYNFNAVGFPEYQLLQTDEQRLLCGNTMQNGDWQEPELMLFSGLKDKNGNDVFEGDHLKHTHDERLLIWEVQFVNGVFGIVNINGDHKSNFFPCDGSKYFFSDREVIGNCYEPSQKNEAKPLL